MVNFNILLVEDNIHNRYAIKAILKDFQHLKLDVAESGDMALKLLNKGEYHLILMDIQLPDASGLDMVELIKKRRKFKNVPIILMTGVFLTDKDRLIGFEKGAIDYIFKPFNDEELLNKINYYYEQNKIKQDLVNEINEANRILRLQNEKLVNTQSMLKQSEKIWKYLGENIPDIILILDNQSIIQFINKPVENMISNSDIGSSIIDKFNEYGNYPISKMINTVKRKLEVVDFEINIQSSEKWYQCRLVPLTEDNKRLTNIMLILTNKTKDKLYAKRIEYLTFHDGLTGLYNRNYFEHYLLNFDLDKQLPVSIIIADMNSLKLINDAFGHHKGDQLLHRAAQFLKDNFRENDVLVRWGGDEFIVLLPQTGEQEAQRLIRILANKEFDIQDDILSPHFALGAATMTDNSITLNQLIRDAENRMYRNKLRDSKSFRSFVIESLKKTLFEKDYETKDHTDRMEKMAVIMANKLNMTSTDQDEISLLASLHDIGKITISEDILLKNGPLTDEEWEVVKRHPEIGYNICKTVPELMQIADAILSHHERWDGKGYPQGLEGEDIPFLARMISVIDTYDVMTHSRPYKKASTHEEAIGEIIKCSGTQFDPVVVEKFIEVFGGEKQKL